MSARYTSLRKIEIAILDHLDSAGKMVKIKSMKTEIAENGNTKVVVSMLIDLMTVQRLLEVTNEEVVRMTSRSETQLSLLHSKMQFTGKGFQLEIWQFNCVSAFTLTACSQE